MAGFADTVELERSLLKALTTSDILARTYMGGVTEDLFTSLPRKFVFGLAKKSLEESGVLLTERVYMYGVGSRFDKTKLAPFIAEWKCIDGVTDYDPPEVIIAQLKLAKTGREILKISEDAISKLQSGDVEEAISLIKTRSLALKGTTEVRHSKPLSDITSRRELIKNKIEHPELYAGLKTGFEKFDKVTGGLFPGELTLLAGVTGLGKSTMCKALARNIVTLNPGKNVLHVANEEYEAQVQYKYDAAFTGIPYYKFKNPQYMEPYELAEWERFMQNEIHANGRGEIYPFEVPAFTDVTLVEQEYRYLENKGIKIDCIIIDHLPHVKPIQQAWNENDELKKAAADCKELARMLNVPVILPTQAATEVEDKQMKGKRASKMDVYGSKGQVHVANTFIILTYKGTDDRQTHLKPEDRDVIWLVDCKKNRDGKAFCFEAIHHVNTGVVEALTDEEAEEIHSASGASYSGGGDPSSSFAGKKKKMIDKVMSELDDDSVQSNMDNRPKSSRKNGAVDVSSFVAKQKHDAMSSLSVGLNDFPTEPPPDYGKPPPGAVIVDEKNGETGDNDIDIFSDTAPF